MEELSSTQQETAKQTNREAKKGDKTPNHSHQNNMKVPICEFLVLCAILLTGLALRCIYLHEISGAPDFSYPEMDAYFHDYWARALVNGDWTPPPEQNDPEVNTSPFFRPPGYPYFLALVYYLSGSSYLIIRIIQIVLGLVNCVMVYLIGRQIFNGAVGLIFATLMSVYWEFIFFEGELLAPVLLIFLGLALVYTLCTCIDKFTYLRIITAGLLFGSFALTRPNILLCGPVILAWIWKLKHQNKDGPGFGSIVIVFIITISGVIAPATLRNYLVSKDIVLITANGGVNLYIGNNEHTNCVWPSIPILSDIAPELLEGWTSFDNPKLVEGVEKIVGRDMKHSEVSRFFTIKALNYIQEHPLQTLKLTFKKALLFWGPYEISNNKEIYCERRNSAVLRSSFSFPLILSTSVVGILLFFQSLRSKDTEYWQYRQDSRKQLYASWLVILLILSYSLSYMPFFVAIRYRVAIVPFLLLFSALGIYHIYTYTLKRKRIKFITWLGVCGILYVITSFEFLTYIPNVSRWHLNRGSKYLHYGQVNKAISEYNQILQINPLDASANFSLGVALNEQGKYEQALQCLTTVMQTEPNWAETQIQIGLAKLNLGKLDEAVSHFQHALDLDPNSAIAHNNIGVVLGKQGKLDEAVTYYTKAVQLDQNYAKAYSNLAEVLLMQGKYTEASVHCSQAIRLDPNYAEAHYNLGMIMDKMGNAEQAVNSYRNALKINPDYLDAHAHLVDVLAKQKLFDETVFHLSEVVRLDPNNEAAHYNLAGILFRKGNLTEATNHYNKVLRINPNNKKALRMLSEIKDRSKSNNQAEKP